MRRLAPLMAAAALLAVGCVGGDDGRIVTPLPTAPSPSVTNPSAAQQIDANAFPTRWPIKHVVFLIKENRTFDHLFGRFPGARGVTVGMDDGVERRLERGTDQRSEERRVGKECRSRWSPYH